LFFFVGLVGNDGSDAARPCRLAVGLAGVAFVADGGARLNVGSDVEQGCEVTPVEGFAAGQVEGDDVAGGVRFCLDLRGEADARTSERLPVLPPLLRPPTDARARWLSRTSEGDALSNSWMPECRRTPRRRQPCSSDRSASATLFQGPKRSGRARQRTFSTVKTYSASRKRRSSSAFRPRRGRQARNTEKRVRPIVLIHACRHRPRPYDSVGVL
jgi:hypothetical protein